MERLSDCGYMDELVVVVHRSQVADVLCCCVGLGRAELQAADLLPDGLDPQERQRTLCAALRRQDRAALLQLRAPGNGLFLSW